MRIDDFRSDRVGGSAGKSIQSIRRTGAASSAPAVEAGRGDSVEISEEARALAAGGEVSVQGALEPERLGELRRWLANGGHNDPAVLRQVAEKLLANGELTEQPS